MNTLSPPEKEVKTALESQIEAWNACDLEKAMSLYWNSPEILWINKSGITKGYEPVLEYFKQEYADTSKMGIYSYEPLYMETLSPNTVYFVFNWKIELNGKKIMGCVSSQVWKKINDSWVITSEHAS